jgi:hypothetical protein
MKRINVILKRTMMRIVSLAIVSLLSINCKGNEIKSIKEKSSCDSVVNDSIKITLGAFILQVPLAWTRFSQSEISTLKSQYQEQSKQIYLQYSGSDDNTKTVDIVAFHIFNNVGTFAIVSFSIPPQSDLIALLKSQIADKMEWGVREGYIRKYLGLVEIDNEHFSGFYTKAIGKTGEIEISGGLEHKKLKNTIIQLTLLCPKGWDATKATNTITALLKTVRIKGQ